MKLVLHGYWRSTAAYRVRIALNLKGLEYSQSPVNLRAGEHGSSAYLDLNAQGLVPALEIDGAVLTQSVPIIEWLNETYPEPPLLPADALGRARVRALAAIISNDIHPLNNLRVLNRLRGELNADEGAVSAWIAQWITAGFAAVEAHLTAHPRRAGASPGLAECCLTPQVYAARRFGVSLEAFPSIMAIAEQASQHPAFILAEPDRQADAP